MSRKILFQLGCLVCLFYTHIKLSYNFNEAWWHSMAGTAAMCIFGILIWKKEFWKVSGLKIGARALPGVTIVTVIATAACTTIIFLLAKSQGIKIVPGTWAHYLHNAFYILNEEVILGALLLYLVIKKFGMSPLAASALLALVLALAHLALYKWYFRDHDLLFTSTVVTLFMVVFIKNNLIIGSGHIGYAWSLHFAWMAVMYGSLHYRAENGELLTDLEKFNTYLGSTPVVILSTAGAAWSLFIVLKKRTTLPEIV